MPAVRNRSVSCRIHRTVLTSITDPMSSSSTSGYRVPVTRIMGQQATMEERKRAKEARKCDLEGTTPFVFYFKFSKMARY